MGQILSRVNNISDNDDTIHILKVLNIKRPSMVVNRFSVSDSHLLIVVQQEICEL